MKNRLEQNVNRIILAIGLDTIGAEEIQKRAGSPTMSIQLIGALTPRTRKGAVTESPCDGLLAYAGDEQNSRGNKENTFHLTTNGLLRYHTLKPFNAAPTAEAMAAKSSMNVFRKPAETKDLPLTALFVDHSYQRDEKPGAQRNLSDFCAGLAGAAEVSDRGRGSNPRYSLMDGQQRYVAAGKQGFKTLKCNIHTGLTVADEAKFYFVFNKKRLSMAPSDSIRARASQGDLNAQGLIADLLAAKFRFDGPAERRIGGAGQLLAVRQVVVDLGMVDAVKRAAVMYANVWPAHRPSAQFVIAITAVLASTPGLLDEGGLRASLKRKGKEYFDDFMKRPYVKGASGDTKPLRLAEEMLVAYNYKRVNKRIENMRCIVETFGERIKGS